MRRLSAIILLLSGLQTLGAQKPDSVYIRSPYTLQLIYHTDSVPTIKEFNFENGMNVEVLPQRAATEDDISFWGRGQGAFAYDDLEFHKDFDSVLIGHAFSDCYFFAPDRYAKVTKHMYENPDGEIELLDCETHNWRQYAIDSLNVLLLFENYGSMNEEPPGAYINKLILSVKHDRYYEDRLFALKPDTAQRDYSSMLRSRAHVTDVDTLTINGRQGLYTLTGKEVIPAVYDSLITDHLSVRAYNGRKMVIYDYLGHVVRDNIKRAYPFNYRYRVLDNDNRLFWMDEDGNEYESYHISLQESTNDILCSEKLPFDAVIVPPAKKKKNRKNDQWVGLEWLYNDKGKLLDKDRFILDLKTTDEKALRWWGHIALRRDYDLIESSGLLDYLMELDERQAEMFPYPHIQSPWSVSRAERLFYYDIDRVYEIPREYKDPVLVTGGNKTTHLQDSPLRLSYIIAKYKGKYGVIDAYNPEKPVLPFDYDKIETHGYYLTLHEKGLICYYPAGITPKYKELDLWGDFMRFTLPDGRQGWLLRNGEEFLDNE